MEFWELMGEVRAEVAKSAEWPSGMQVGQALSWHLRRFEPVQILEFDLWIRGQASLADRWEFGAACFLFCGSASEDGFGEFRFGLVGLGHDVFRAVLRDPDRSLAELPIVQAMAAGHASPFTLHGEQIQAAASEAYGDHYWDDRAPFEHQPPGPRFGPADASQIPAHLPALQALFKS